MLRNILILSMAIICVMACLPSVSVPSKSGCQLLIKVYQKAFGLLASVLTRHEHVHLLEFRQHDYSLVST